MITNPMKLFTLALLLGAVAALLGGWPLALASLALAALTWEDAWPALRPHWTYLRKVLAHKWHVYRAGRALGVGRWQLIVHDLSKFGRAEWGPYVAYEPYHGRPDAAPPAVKAAFDAAWRHHWQANPHHWVHWCDPIFVDDPAGEPLRMPDRYVREMVADWVALGVEPRALDAATYYRGAGPHMRLHVDTRVQVELLLRMAVERGLIPAERSTS